MQNVASKGHQRLMQNSTNGLRSVQRLAQSSSSNLQQLSNSLNSSFDDCVSKTVNEALILILIFF